MSRLNRNVAIVNLLEMSPFCVVVFWLECEIALLIGATAFFCGVNVDFILRSVDFSYPGHGSGELRENRRIVR
jgi:hypothetical protein